jgi:hypothetical protein
MQPALTFLNLRELLIYICWPIDHDVPAGLLTWLDLMMRRPSSHVGSLDLQGNDNILEKAAAPIATVASHADPWPHYLMSVACEQTWLM